jgi:pimeloyl-ACP methyl ester carboxylesterase
MRRAGDRAPIVILHGFGSTKEDYADSVHVQALNGHPVLAFDAPGFGESRCDDTAHVSIPFLVETARSVLGATGIDRFHLVGHSMGGLTGLMLAHSDPGRVISFIDIEGNVAPEDCFLSRQIVTHQRGDPNEFLDAFVDRAWHSTARASQLYAASVCHKVRATAVPGIFASMVELSDTGDLLTKFLGLPMPRMFMYGDENRSLTYLPRLLAGGIELAEIPACGHFPMYSNPVAMWERIGTFLTPA